VTTEQTVNYTSQQETELQDLYQSGQPIDALAQHFNKSERSIVAKLSRMGIYQPKKPRGPSTRTTKAGLVTQLAELIDLDPDILATLDKADKAALEAVVSMVRAKLVS
jgi:hypothetical protein